MRAGEYVTPQVRLARVLGAGGMGSVWVAQHLTLKTEVAVKVILAGHENDGDARERFSREAEAAAQVKSPHVAQIFDHGVTEDGIPFIVMELLDGEDLGRYMQRVQRVSVREASMIVTQVCRALARAHAKGLVHRDVKPANIFLCDVGTPERFVKLLDFGVAKIVGTDPASITKSGSITGTPAYMAPEQLLGNRDIDHRADLFSVAVLAYELLFGRRPIVEDNAVAIALRMHTKGMPRATEEMPELDDAVRETIDGWFAHAWAVDPKARYSSATTLAEEFDTLARLLGRAQGVASGQWAPVGELLTLRDSMAVSGETLASGREPSGPNSAVTVSAPISNLETPAPRSRAPEPRAVPDVREGEPATVGPGAQVQTVSPLSRPPISQSAPASTKVRPDRPRNVAVWAASFVAVVAIVALVIQRGKQPAPAAPLPPPGSSVQHAPVASQSTIAATTTAPTQIVSVPASTTQPSVSATATATGKKVPIVAPSASSAKVVPSASVKKLEDIE